MSSPLSAHHIVITAPRAQELSREQQAFNRLTGKIEKMRRRLEERKNELDKALIFYQTEVSPLIKQISILRNQEIVLLYDFYSGKISLRRRQKECLKEYLLKLLDDAFFSDANPGNEITKIFEALEGVSYEHVRKEAFEELKNETEKMFSDQGIQTDFSGVNFNSKEDILRKAFELREQMERHTEEINSQRAKRKKTKRQIEKEQRELKKEEMRKQSISSIYRQLAKILHPDLEQNEEAKAEKEVLMKEVIAAYENNDITTLLRLEMQWLTKETNRLWELGDERIGIYNELMKEQIAELELKIKFLSLSIKYQPIEHLPNQYGEIDCSERQLIREKKRSQGLLKEYIHSVDVLRSPFATRQVFAIIDIMELDQRM